jgi:diadenosine tetraphosphate (Ap4A) HIT family hydrolase
MDRDNDLSQPLTRGIFPAEGCRCCAIVQRVASRGTIKEADYVAETANEEALMLSGPQLAGLVVIPKLCISGLEELPALRRAHVLAALRRATVLVRQENQGSTSRIVTTIDSSAPAGHVSFQVLPCNSGDSKPALWTPPPP